MKSLLSLSIAFFYLSAAIAAPTATMDQRKFFLVNLPLMVNMKYQSSETLESLYTDSIYTPAFRQAALAKLAGEKLNMAPPLKMTMTTTDAQVSYKFPSEKAELVFNKTTKGFSLNGRVLHQSGLNFEGSLSEIAKILETKSAQTSGLFSFAEAMGTPLFLALCVAGIIGFNAASRVYAEYEINKSIDTQMKSKEHQIAAESYIIANHLSEFVCSPEGNVTKQTGDMGTSLARFQLELEKIDDLKSIQVKLNKGELSESQARNLVLEKAKEIRLQAKNLPKPQHFEFTYIKSGVDSIEISSPPCLFRVYGRNQIALKTETKECQSIPLSSSETGKNLTIEEFLKSLGFNAQAAIECCQSKCKDIVAQYLAPQAQAALAAPAMEPTPAPARPGAR